MTDQEIIEDAAGCWAAYLENRGYHHILDADNEARAIRDALVRVEAARDDEPLVAVTVVADSPCHADKGEPCTCSNGIGCVHVPLDRW